VSLLTDQSAAVEELHAALLAADSATAVLENWFGPVTVARLQAPPSVNEGLTERLRLASGDILRHRAVRLMARARVLSQAELWYVANRLPAARVQQLESSEIPFGRIMQPVGLKRSVLLARICAPEEVALLAHRALLSAPSGLPVAEVYELYPKTLFDSS
jgi:chorismate-pyruvate lyase